MFGSLVIQWRMSSMIWSIDEVVNFSDLEEVEFAPHAVPSSTLRILSRCSTPKRWRGSQWTVPRMLETSSAV